MSATKETSESLLSEAERKLEQLTQAMALLDRIGGDVDWALDFSEHQSINEQLSPVSYAIGDAHEEIESMYERLSEEIEAYKTNKIFADKEFDAHCELQYYLE
jgi:hypothetical protein